MRRNIRYVMYLCCYQLYLGTIYLSDGDYVHIYIFMMDENDKICNSDALANYQYEYIIPLFYYQFYG